MVFAKEFHNGNIPSVIRFFFLRTETNIIVVFFHVNRQEARQILT